MELVTEKYSASIRRVDIIRALGECVGMGEMVEMIMSPSGNVKSEGGLVRIENKILGKVVKLRFENKWPPK